MTRQIDDFIEQVRHEDLPDSAREERVFAATLAAIHPPPPGLDAPSTTDSLGAASSGSSLGAGAGLWGTKAAKLAAVLGAACVVTVPVLVLINTEPAPVEVAAPHAQDSAVLLPSEVSSSSKPVNEPSEAWEVMPESATSHQLLAPEPPGASRTPRSSPEEHTLAPDRVRSKQNAPQAVTDDDAEDSSVRAPSLAQELKVLERVQFALKRGKPQEALRLLDAARGSSPALQEERAAARVLAQCIAALSPKAQSSARAFVAQYPQSMHREAIEDTCKTR